MDARKELTPEETLQKYFPVLRLDPTSIQGMDAEKAFEKVHKRYLQLARCHPDKQKNKEQATTQFQKLVDAYEAMKKVLLGGKEGYKGEIDHYLHTEIIYLPLTVFDFILCKNIEEAYKQLLKDFSEIDNPQNKRTFVEHYNSFINLARSLEENIKRFHLKRFNCFMQGQVETVMQSFRRDWRECMISLFGEEYLDDFQYRQALASGSFGSILATRKILSPVKLVIAMINTPLLFMTNAAYIASTRIGNHIQSDVLLALDMLSRIRNLTRAEWVELGWLAGKTVSKIGLLVQLVRMAARYNPALFNIALSLPLLGMLFNIIASPINSIIRPLSNYTNMSLVNVVGMLLVASAIAGYLALNTTTFPILSASMAIQYLIFSSVVFKYFQTAKLIRNTYNLNPYAGIFIFVLTAYTSWPEMTLWLSPLWDPMMALFDANAPVSMWLVISLLSNLAMASSQYFANRYIEDVQSGKVMERLPLPEEFVPVEVTNATLLGVKRASQSHFFFKTPKDADYVEPSQRTFWQQTSSFFGGGEVKRKATYQLDAFQSSEQGASQSTALVLRSAEM